MKRIGLFLWTLATATALWAGEEKDLQLASPDGTHRIAFWQKTVSPGVNELCKGGKTKRVNMWSV